MSTRAAREAGRIEAITAAASSTKAETSHGQGTGHLQVAEIAAGNTSHDEAERGSGKHTRRGHDGAFANDGTQNIFRLRAEGEPDAKLARARADGKGQHTGDSDDGDRERYNRKNSKDERVQAVGRENFRAYVFEGRGMFNGLIHGHVANDAGNRRNKRIGIRRRVDEEMAAIQASTVGKRVVNGCCRFRHNVNVVYVACHADDAVRRFHACLFGIVTGKEFKDGIGPVDVASNSTLTRPHALSQSLADDHDGLALPVVEVVEIASFQ